MEEIKIDNEVLHTSGASKKIVKEYQQYLKEKGISANKAGYFIRDFAREVLNKKFYNRKDKVGKLRKYIMQLYPGTEGVYTPAQQREIMARNERKRIYP